SYSLARAYREDGKNRKEIFVKLGKLSDEAANQWRTLLKALKKPGSFITTGDDIAVVNHYAYLDVATVMCPIEICGNVVREPFSTWWCPRIR
ncbi:MAG: hypothetical protein U9Q39_04955, partial [Pseudomonadota bacterium]|nr:hypothetical protein [Pseudomonadota bacterium]